jgi:glycerol-3-phosphate dehydrogenase
MKNNVYDIIVIGGGINGTGIALDAAGRGLSVALCEQNDLASGTSSESTKLIHGGLRYLEHGDFKLVHEALNEREVLMAKAPHIISPLSFIIPYQPQIRPQWLIRLGLWLYDHLGLRVTLPKSRAVVLKNSPLGAPLKNIFTDGFMYSDCWVDDARLVVENAMAAKALGADIFTQCKVERYGADNGIWEVEVQYEGRTQVLHSKALVNATGPWIQSQSIRTKLVKGSHIIVPRIYEGDHAYLIQQADKRVIFVIPFQQNFTLIGTTDKVYHGDPGKAHIDDDEKSYLVTAFNQYFETKLSEKDIVAAYSGVRPLVDDGKHNPSDTTREYLLLLEQIQDAPILSVFGGKITTYRTLSEHALNKLAPFFPHIKSAWTKQAILPGGDLPNGSLSQYIATVQSRFPFLSFDELSRLAHLYGTRVNMILDGSTSKTDLGEYFGGGCYERELRYAIDHEFVKKPEDFLRRRTKLYLTLNPSEIKKISVWIEKNGV